VSCRALRAHGLYPLPASIDSEWEGMEDCLMDAARASIEIQLILAVGVFFALMVVVAAIDLWYGTSGDNRGRPLR